jgi:hypothetical protein
MGGSLPRVIHEQRGLSLLMSLILHLLVSIFVTSFYVQSLTCLLVMYSPEIILVYRFVVAARTAICSSHFFRNLLIKLLFRHALKHQRINYVITQRVYLRCDYSLKRGGGGPGLVSLSRVFW